MKKNPKKGQKKKKKKKEKEGNPLIITTHQFNTIALAFPSSLFNEMLCCINASISTMSLRNNGCSTSGQPFATESPTTPPPAPSSSLPST